MLISVLDVEGYVFFELISVATFGHYMSLVAMCSLVGNYSEILIDADTQVSK